jgi:hypothetical protein
LWWTNVIESMISICREHANNVKYWQDGQMALRWCTAGMLEAGKQFRRVNGHMHLRALRAELQRVTVEADAPDRQMTPSTPHDQRAADRSDIKWYGSGDAIR